MGVWIAVAVGGALGSVARHGVNHLVQARWFSDRFPAGTATVNLLGCLAIGLLSGLVAADRITVRPYWREFVYVGVIGGFTTFSTFGLDTLVLARSSSVAALINVGIQVVGGLTAVWAGHHLGLRR